MESHIELLRSDISEAGFGVGPAAGLAVGLLPTAPAVEWPHRAIPADGTGHRGGSP